MSCSAASPRLQGIGPDQLTLGPLVERVRSGTIREVILATNPNLEGDGTAMLVARALGESTVPITRLARGLASGSVLEFANKEMLADALSGRQPLLTPASVRNPAARRPAGPRRARIRWL